MIEPTLINAALSLEHVLAPGGETVEHEIFKETGRVARHRYYHVYLPAGYTAKRKYPLLMVLHGCRQDHHDIQTITGFDAIADRVGAIVVYPYVTTYAGIRTENCWGWWLTRERQRGQGEVADLRQIAEDVSDTYSVDCNKRHICGLSSGAAMTVASLASYSDFWASGASVGGVPYGESANSVRSNPHVPVRRKSVSTLVRMLSRELVAPAPSLLVVQSDADTMVGPRLGANLRDTWVTVSGCRQQAAEICTDESRGFTWQFEQYLARGALQVGHILLEGLEHGWPGGLPGQYCFPDAPNISELIWTFFEQSGRKVARYS